jgi:hypothetical protein
MPDYQPAALERNAARHSRQAESTASSEVQPRPHALLRLQSRVGNASVARLIQRAGEEDELQMKHDPSLVQRAGEKDELQMKHDASLVRRADEEDELQMKHAPLVQRLDEQPLRRAASAPVVGLEGGPVGAEIEGRVKAQLGGGSQLPGALRTTMESGFGQDFSGVRVHQNSESDALNRSMTAKAFTTGSDIFLRGDASPADDRLMAHELTHVVQQSSGRSLGNGMSAGPADDPQEHEADRTAEAVLASTTQRKAEEDR